MEIFSPCRMKPGMAVIKERRRLSASNSSKETFHLVLDTGSIPLEFKVGDSVGIYPQNNPFLVQQLLETMQATGKEQIPDPRSQTPLSLTQFLSQKANLSKPTASFLAFLCSCDLAHDKKNTLYLLLQQDNKTLLAQYLTTHDLLDVLKEYPLKAYPLQELCKQMSPLLPRFYSIASSPSVYKKQIHLTVRLCKFMHKEELRYGVCSHFLCSLAEINCTPIPFYIQASSHFTLPANDNASVILIGPGTGIAPCRAFLQERIARGAKGKNWLFFGECQRASNCLYEEELEHWKKEKHLRLSFAFSRDQPEKIYVQHRMLEESADVWKWLQEGAYLYVCGDAHHMAKDVAHTLHEIVKKEGGLSDDAARQYIKQLRASKHYLMDVY